MKLTDLKYLEENERARYAKIEAERQRISEWQAFDDIGELSLFHVKKEQVADVFKVFSQHTYDAYGDLFHALVEYESFGFILTVQSLTFSYAGWMLVGSRRR